jgi:two-component system sensor histidine kinase AtoS
MPRELSLIAQSFNRMSIDLKEKIEKTRKSEQSELMREVAAGLAHEIKNPLAGIRGALEIFMNELSLSKEDKAVFEEMLFQVKKLDILTKCFLEYARPPSPQFIPTSINDILNNTVGFLTKHNLHKNLEKVEILRELGDDLPIVAVDPIQLQQIIMNLVFNALDAMPSGGKIIFRTAYDGDSVEISVSDTGHGMEKEVADNIFKPFFTTKAKGMGIGLSICKRLVEQHNGTISVSSGESGTTFSIRLPKSTV